jgi:N-acetylglucosaminyl-diphospho-decaprenol L-rhamnosyltransferase
MGRIMASPPTDPAGSAVGVVTVSYGSDRVLVDFLRSIAGASTRETQIVIVDNLPSAGSPTAALAAGAHARYAPMESNVGYGSAMDAGVALLPQDIRWVLLSNPDVILSAGCIDELVRVASQDERIAVVGPALLTSDGEIYPSARAVPSLRTGVGHALFVNLWVENPWTRAYRNDRAAQAIERDAGWLSGACLLVRRELFEKVGGFDPGYFMYFEDVDLGYRLGKAGYRNVYAPSAVATHSGAHSTTTESTRMISAHHDSARRFLNRKYSGPWLWPIRVALTIGLQLRSTLLRRRITANEETRSP